MTENASTAEVWRETSAFDDQADDVVARAEEPSKRAASGPGKKEWASTLLLVEEACESIKAAEERVEALERELELAAAKAREEQRQLIARIHSAQEEIQASQAKAKAWETRALEAESWLNRLNDAIVTNFGGVARREEPRSN